MFIRYKKEKKGGNKMRLTKIKDGSARCKRCADGTLAEFLVSMDAANREIPLCKNCATDICTIYDLKVLQAVNKGEII